MSKENKSVDELAKEMDKAIRCLAIELPEAVWLDVNQRWVSLKVALYTTPQPKDTSGMQWQLCPKCNGNGNLPIADVDYATGIANFTCDLCNGKKVIEPPSAPLLSTQQGEDDQKIIDALLLKKIGLSVFMQEHDLKRSAHIKYKAQREAIEFVIDILRNK